MRLKHLLFTFALTTIFLIAGKVGWGQESIATWTFPTTTGNETANISAECGAMFASSMLYLDGTNGSSDWISTSGSVVYFGGTNPPSELCSVTTATGALSLVNIGSAFNGSSIVFKISMTGYQDLSLTYSTRGTSTGFTTHEWLYSTDGSSFTTVSTITGRNVTSFSSQSVDFSSIAAIENQSNVYIKLTVSGASGTGNNRLDNINFVASSSIADETAPVWSDTYPMIDGITKTSAVLKVSTDEPGKAFYQVLADGAAAPAVDDLIAAGTEIAIAAGTTEYTANLSGLTQATAYDVYVVAQDDETTPNKQAAVTKIDLLTLAASNAAEITAFSFAEQTGPATINSAAGTIDVQVTGGVSNLVATFTLSDAASAAVGGVPQVSATTANDFSSDVTYTVTAEDGVTTKDWVVSVSVPSTDATITSTVYSVDGGTFAISNVPFNTPVDAFKSRLTPATAATFEVYESDGTTLATTLATGHKVIVTAEAGNTQAYTIELLAAPTGDLFISEYIEGSSSNKAVEIYNGTGVALDLATYTMRKGTNGADFSTTLTLSGILNSGEVYVIANNGAVAAIKDQADLIDTDGFIVFFNGDDAVGLFNNGSLIDVIGYTIGVDPGTAWPVAGIANATADRTIIRKASITAGNVDWALSSGTNETDSEWEVYPKDYIGGLGSHNQPKLSAEANITAFDVPGQVGDEVINTTAYTVTIGVTAATVKTALVPTIAVSAGATIDPASGVEQDFSAGKSYVVTAEGANTQSWNVTVNSYSNDATLSDLKVAGATVTGFASETIEYGVEVPFGSTEVPAVTYTVNQDNATAVVTNAAGIPGSTTVEVTSQDLTTTKTYTINFTEAAAKTDATLSALTVNGVDVLAYANLVVDPSTEPGATMWFNNFTDAMGIVATQNDADATVSIKKNDVEVVDPANETLADNDVILITVTAQDVAVIKYYKITLQQKPIITATAGENGEIAPAGAVVVDYDATQAFTATAASGYHIAALNVNGTPVAEAANQTEYTYTFNNVVADATIDATFEITKYTVTFTVKEGTTPLEGATVALAGYPNQTTNASGVATFTDVVPNLLAYTVTLDGYNTVEGNITVDGNKNVDIAMVSSAVPTYSVIFTVKEGEVAVEAATVALTGYGEQQTDASGVATFTGVPASADVAYTVNKTGFVEATGAVTVVDADVNQAVALTRVNYTIAASAGENGTITPTGDVSVAHGNNQAFDVEATAGYHIASLLVNGTEVAEAAGVASYTYTFSNVTAAQTIAATFAINTYTITVTAGENGTTTPAANQIVNHGGEVVFTITANEGYHIKDVLVDGVSVGAVASYTFTNVTANASIETQFEINSYTVTAFAAPTEGGVITGAGSYTHGQEVTLTATPNEGYTFVRWRSGATTLSTSATYVFNATADVEVAAVFTQFTGDLFFSEFIEGSSNNKGFEIFNPNGTTVDLTKYKVKLSNNGAGFGIPSGQTVEDTRYVLPLTGTLAAGEVLVVANASAIQAILDKADVTLAYNSTANGCDGCNVVSFNGDDALGLFKDDVLIDVVGEGVHDDTNNPIDGWDVAGTTLATKDYTLVRKSSVTEGTTTWTESAGTDADNSQWIVYPKDNVEYLGTHNVVLPSNEAEIFTYTFAEQVGAATISSATGLIEIEVISSADLTSLVASFTTSENATVKVADVAQVSGTTPNDFSADVVYTVTAEDGTVKQWTVRVTKSAAQSSEKAILTYSINEVDATIDANAYTVAVTLPYDTDLTALVATFTVSPGASAKVAEVAQVSGTTANDFTAAVVYVVTAEDGSTQNWTVTVSTEAPLTGKDILTYTIAEVDATVNATDHSVTATLPYGTDVTALVATFTLSEEATAKVVDVEQVSGTTANDFTNPVVYTVTAQDGTTQDWTVTIALGAASSEAFVTSTVYTVDDTEGTITAVPYGTTLAAFKANITPANYATFEVYQADGTTVATGLETGYKLTVTAQDEVANKTYTITVAEPSSSDLFFSEYIEGSSNNKAIEIYNPTGASVDLSIYSVKLSPNGDPWGTPQALTGTLASGEVFVITNAGAGAEIKAQSDLESTVTYFNGNDAVGLFKNDVLIDVIGVPEYKPATVTSWAVAGIDGATIDHTLVRRGNVVVGTTDWAASAGTNADDSQWIVNAKDDFTTLGTHSTALSAEAEITAFSFAEQVAAATIDATSGTITIEVLYGTDLTGLVSTFTVSAGAKAYVNDVLQVSGTTANNFTNDVVYKVVAEDGTIKNWTVTVTMPAQPSTAAEIVSFVLAEQTGAATINSAAGTIAIEVNSSANLAALTPTIQVSAGASISPASGAVQDFTNPVTYTVTAQDNNTTKPWTVTVTKPQVNVVTITQIQQPTGGTGDSPFANQIVETTGIVTAIQAGKGFFIQDGEGAWSGILVYTNTATGLPAIGDEVKVKGWVKEYYSYTEITTNATPAVTVETTVLSSGNTLPAATVLTSQAVQAEEYEGVLVKVESAEVISGPSTYKEYIVNDGSGELTVDDKLYEPTFTVGTRYSITGVMDYSFDVFKLLPRDASDIATGIDDVKWGGNLEVYPNPFTNTINFSNVEDVELITVTNLIGQRVMTVKPESSNSINTDNLIKGIYLVSFQNRDGKVIVKKMIKQ